MKAITQTVLLFLFVCFVSAPFSAPALDCPAPQQLEQQPADLTYTWNAVLGAESYVIEVVNRTTNETSSQEVSSTSATFTGLSSGTYDIIVTAKMANGSSSIVIADESEL